MEEHQDEVEVREELMAIVAQFLTHLHCSQRELELLVVYFFVVKPVLFAFGILALCGRLDLAFELQKVIG